MNILKKIGILAAAAIFVVLVSVFITVGCDISKESTVARSPKKIAALTGFELPSYEEIGDNDNPQCEDCNWQWSYYELKLKKPLSKKQKAQLDRLVRENVYWQNLGDDGGAYYVYNDNEEGCAPSGTVQMTIDASSRKVTIRYDYQSGF